MPPIRGQILPKSRFPFCGLHQNIIEYILLKPSRFLLESVHEKCYFTPSYKLLVICGDENSHLWSRLSQRHQCCFTFHTSRMARVNRSNKKFNKHAENMFHIKQISCSLFLPYSWHHTSDLLIFFGLLQVFIVALVYSFLFKQPDYSTVQVWANTV